MRHALLCVVCAQNVSLNLATLANVVEESEAESTPPVKLMLQASRQLRHFFQANPADAVSAEPGSEEKHVLTRSSYKAEEGLLWLKSAPILQVAGEEGADRPVKVFLDMEHPIPALSPKVPIVHCLSQSPQHLFL